MVQHSFFFFLIGIPFIQIVHASAALSGISQWQPSYSHLHLSVILFGTSKCSNISYISISLFDRTFRYRLRKEASYMCFCPPLFLKKVGYSNIDLKIVVVYEFCPFIRNFYLYLFVGTFILLNRGWLVILISFLW